MKEMYKNELFLSHFTLQLSTAIGCLTKSASLCYHENTMVIPHRAGHISWNILMLI